MEYKQVTSGIKDDNTYSLRFNKVPSDNIIFNNYLNEKIQANNQQNETSYGLITVLYFIILFKYIILCTSWYSILFHDTGNKKSRSESYEVAVESHHEAEPFNFTQCRELAPPNITLNQYKAIRVSETITFLFQISESHTDIFIKYIINMYL